MGIRFLMNLLYSSKKKKAEYGSKYGEYIIYNANIYPWIFTEKYIFSINFFSSYFLIKLEFKKFQKMIFPLFMKIKLPLLRFGKSAPPPSYENKGPCIKVWQPCPLLLKIKVRVLKFGNPAPLHKKIKLQVIRFGNLAPSIEVWQHSFKI